MIEEQKNNPTRPQTAKNPDVKYSEDLSKVEEVKQGLNSKNNKIEERPSTAQKAPSEKLSNSKSDRFIQPKWNYGGIKKDNGCFNKVKFLNAADNPIKSLAPSASRIDTRLKAAARPIHRIPATPKVSQMRNKKIDFKEIPTNKRLSAGPKPTSTR